MPLFSRRESEFLILLNQIVEIIINRLKVLIESLIVVAFKHSLKLLYIFEVFVSVIQESFLMVMMIPACSNWSLNGNTMLVFFVLKAFINFFELFFVGFETVAGEPFVFGCIWWIFSLLCLKDSFFLFESEWMHSEGFDNCAPFLSYSHLLALQVLILVFFPVQEYLFFLLSISKVDEFSFQNNDSVLLLFGYFWY